MNQLVQLDIGNYLYGRIRKIHNNYSNYWFNRSDCLDY